MLMIIQFFLDWGEDDVVVTVQAKWRPAFL